MQHDAGNVLTFIMGRHILGKIILGGKMVAGKHPMDI